MRSLILALPLLLVACTQDERAPVDSTVEEITPRDTVAGDDRSLADPAPGSVTAPAPATAAIPIAMQGRWGMTPADCEPGRADAKGLMTIGVDSLSFYESRGTLREVVSRGPEELAARFAFTGEGMEWETEETLRLQDNGTVLVRRSSDQEGQIGPFTYRRCG